MFSVTYTGMNFRPLCTAIVCPTISGIIVERRDHVRSTFFSLRAFMPSTFVARCASTNGPFLVERAMISSVETRLAASHLAKKTGQAPSLQLTFFPAVHDIRIGPFVVSRLVSPRRLAPGGHR